MHGMSIEDNGNQCDQSKSVVNKAVIAKPISKALLQIPDDRQGDQGTVKEAPDQPGKSKEDVFHSLFQVCLHQLTGQLSHGGYLRAKELFVEGADPRGGCPVSALGPHRGKSRQVPVQGDLAHAVPTRPGIRRGCRLFRRIGPSPAGQRWSFTALTAMSISFGCCGSRERGSTLPVGSYLVSVSPEFDLAQMLGGDKSHDGFLGLRLLW